MALSLLHLTLRYPRCMRVRVLYLGILKELSGQDSEWIHVDEGSTVRDVWARLGERVPRLAGFQRSVATAVNHSYAPANTVLREGDELALLPPVSGGASRARAEIVRAPIDTAAIAASVRAPEDGAVALFDGVVRNNTRGRKTLYLEYEAYEELALKQMNELADKALSQFAVRDVRIVHRLGRLEIGESSVFIAVASAHRGAAFDACRWLIDTLKKTVPIYKKEYFEDGAVWADGDAFPPEIPQLTS
jgi:molybdopterin synthase catalytic subunit/molybdopterin converting factor small subunit